jgi:hypothetical protein
VAGHDGGTSGVIGRPNASFVTSLNKPTSAQSGSRSTSKHLATPDLGSPVTRCSGARTGVASGLDVGRSCGWSVDGEPSMTHGGSAIVVSTRDRRRGIDGQHRCLERQIIYRCVRRLAAANLAARITTFVTSAMTVCRSGDDAPTTGSRPSVVSRFRQSTSRNGPLRLHRAPMRWSMDAQAGQPQRRSDRVHHGHSRRTRRCRAGYPINTVHNAIQRLTVGFGANGPPTGIERVDRHRLLVSPRC